MATVALKTQTKITPEMGKEGESETTNFVLYNQALRVHSSECVWVGVHILTFLPLGYTNIEFLRTMLLAKQT